MCSIDIFFVMTFGNTLLWLRSILLLVPCRLEAEASGNQRVLQDNANLTRTLAEKEKELTQLKGCLGNCQSELNLVKPQLAKALQELDSLRKRLGYSDKYIF